MLYREEAAIVDHDVDARTITVQLCRWNDPRPVVDPDGAKYREQFPPGSLELADNVHVSDRHQGALVGRAINDTYAADDTGPTIDVAVARTAAGNDALALVDAGVIRAVSMELEPVTEKRSGADLITRTKSIVHGLAFAFRPAHDAPILAVREQGETMPITDTPSLVVDDDTAPIVGEFVTGELLSRELDLIRRDMIAHTPGDPAHPLARFRSLDEAVEAGWSDVEVRNLLSRALVDQITANNPGVIPPSWTSTVYGIIDRGRPAITAFGVDSAGASGMEINWPYFDGNLLTLVGQQVTEKTAITNVRVDLKKGSEDLLTYAGGSDLSYQLIRRSSPSYRDAYMRIMFAAYAAVTDNVVADALVGVTGSTVDYDFSADTTGAGLRSALFQASVIVESVTGAPASFALAASDVFIAIGGMTNVFASPYGVQNVAGTADAASLEVNVNGIRVIHEPNFTAGTLIVSNSQAASWYEDGPFTIAAEDVEKLGQNVAVWGMGAFGVHLPLGIVSLENVAALGASSRRGRKSDD